MPRETMGRTIFRGLNSSQPRTSVQPSSTEKMMTRNVARMKLGIALPAVAKKTPM